MRSRKISTASILAGLGSIALTLHSTYKSHAYSEQAAILTKVAENECPTSQHLIQDISGLHDNLLSTSRYLGLIAMILYGVPSTLSFLESGSNWILWKERLQHFHENWDFFLGMAIQAGGLSLYGKACYELGADNAPAALGYSIAGIFAKKIGSELILNHKPREKIPTKIIDKESDNEELDADETLPKNYHQSR